MSAVASINSAPVRTPQVTVFSPSQGQVVSGITSVDLELSPPPGGALGELRLRVGFPDSAHADYLHPVRLEQGPVRRALAVHTHLLADGPHRVELVLEDEGGNPVWWHTLAVTVANHGPVAGDVRRSLRQSGVPLILAGPCDASLYDYRDESLIPWFDRPDAMQTLEGWLRRGRISESQAGTLGQFVTEGYLEVPDLIEPELIARINREMDQAEAVKYQGYEHGSSMRLEHLHQHFPGIRRLWLHEGIMRWLELIFDGPVGVCQTLTYIFGSQQEAHQDTVHLTPFPAGYMCGVWTAVEDVRPGSGELEIYPRSHRFPRIYMHGEGCPKVAGKDWSEFNARIAGRWRRMLAESGIEKRIYRPKAGTVLIWHENLMHAGGTRQDPSLSRRSVVTHNFAAGAQVFYDSTGMPGNNQPRGLLSAPPP